MDKTIKFILISIGLILHSLPTEANSHFSSTYQHFNIYSPYDGEVKPSPFYLYIKTYKYDGYVFDFLSLDNSPEKHVAELWTSIRDKNSEKYQSLTDENSLNFKTFLFDEIGKNINQNNRLLRRFDIGNSQLYMIETFENNNRRVIPVILKSIGDKYTVDFHSTFQPLPQLLSNQYIYSHSELLDELNRAEDHFKLKLKLPFHEEIPDQNVAYLHIEDRTINFDPLNQPIQDIQEDTIRNLAKKMRALFSIKIDQSINSLLSHYSNNSQQMLKDNYEIYKNTKNPRLSFRDSLFPKKHIQLCTINNDICYMFCTQSKKDFSSPTYYILILRNGEWKIVNYNQLGPLDDLLSNRPVWDQLSSILSNK